MAHTPRSSDGGTTADAHAPATAAIPTYAPPTTTAQSVARALQVNGAGTEPQRPDSWLLLEHYRYAESFR